MSIMVIGLIYPLSKWFSLGGGQLACLAAVVVGYLYQVRRIANVTGIDLRQYWKSFAVPFTISVGMAAICFGMRLIPGVGHPLLNIVLGAAACLVAYALSLAYVIRNMPNLFVQDANQAASPS
jgi:hypothetical protein